MTSGFKVDFLGIGPPKAGTTWLGHMLEAHPQICMSEPKEVHYFNDSLSFNNSYDTVHYPLGLAWYQTHFKHCAAGKIKGEVTPRYILDPVVPERIFNHNPELKLIVCLRSPYERIVSHYHSAKDYHKSEPRPLSQAIHEEPEYIEASLYFKNISRFLPYFSLDRFFFMDMDLVKSNPQKLLSDLYRFLGVDDQFTPPGMTGKSNPARTTRSVRFRKWSGGVHRKLVAMGFSPFIQMLKKMGVGKFINRINSGPVHIVKLSAEDRYFIRGQIEEDVKQLQKLLNKDFTSWWKD
jgi:hypothetical protein